tara:strand:- start:462 stop:2405 length:1944 start_codon:yes stop_codon:yes gene_type:complete
MAKRLFCADVEADDLLDNVTKLWCASATELSPTMSELKSFTLTDMEQIKELFSNPDHILVMHNGVAYDGPAVEKVLGIEVKAEIIDTLFLSWYLYPKMVKHGLATWGEELGIAKPTIDDWSNLSLEEYIFRCKEDVRIQTALWKQIWKHLLLLYGNVEGCWHAIRHLNFKAKCAALQENNRWKLDVEGSQEAEIMFQDKYDTAQTALSARMPEVPEYSTRKRPAKCYNVAGKVSKLGEKWRALVQEHIDPELYYHGDPIDYAEEIKVIKGYKEPNAGSHQQIKKWLNSLGWVPESFKYVRNKNTNEVKVIPQIKNQDTEELCDSIVRLIAKESALDYLREMSIVKHRLSVVQGFLKNVDDDGYVYAAIQGLTNTLRFKHKICCNIPSVRKAYGALIRGLLIASSEDSELCGSDMSSLEDRTKQHYMWPHDPDYVREMMQDGFDPHCDMAIAAGLMTEEEAAWYKAYDKETATAADKTEHTRLALIRHGGKSTNYSATYGAKGPTIARAAGVSEETGDILHLAYWERNWSLNAIADGCTVKNSRGMKWLWNPVANMWFWLKADKDRFSTLNQSTGTFAFDRWVFYILEQRRQLTGQFHDEVILELKKGNREAMTAILDKAMSKVNAELKLSRELGCDVDFGDSYAEIH